MWQGVGEERDDGSLLPWVPFNFSISRRRLLYEQATQIPRLAPLAPFCRQIMAIKCQSCRIPGIFPVPYSVCRIQMLYCKFNNKYKSFPELTAKARPQHTHIHTHRSQGSSDPPAPSPSLSGTSRFSHLKCADAGHLRCARQDGRTNGHGQTPIDGHFSSQPSVRICVGVGVAVPRGAFQKFCCCRVNFLSLWN